MKERKLFWYVKRRKFVKYLKERKKKIIEEREGEKICRVFKEKQKLLRYLR